MPAGFETEASGEVCVNCVPDTLNTELVRDVGEKVLEASCVDVGAPCVVVRDEVEDFDSCGGLD